MNNEQPVAWAREDGVIAFFEKPEVDKQGFKWFPLYTHPAKELHLSLQKNKETGELLAVTYTDDEHRIVEVLWKKPPAKTLTDEFIFKNHIGYLSPNNDFYAPDYPTWKQDGFTPIYKEPVAKTLTDEIEDLKSANRFIQNFAEEQHQRAVALEMRELTDEEITEIFDTTFEVRDFEDSFIKFARAILKKASEK